ncbi:hypothetical protein ACFQ08_07815 [Streptosporangium algeriense]|uniref:DUF2269 domain-containing protein n=1 Tax=Streptosporangium algeriense TaxID=1682748 RepID=A0ABW3DMP4_9ACTN
MLEDVLLVVHVLAAIVFVGGSAVATSLFPRYAPLAAAVPADAPADQGERSPAVAAAMHRITRGYAVAGLVVPVVGLVLAAVQGRTGEIWIVLSMILTAGAAGLLVTQIVPRQRAALDTPGPAEPLRRLSMLAGLYNLIWAIVVIMMIVRPGSGG